MLLVQFAYCGQCSQLMLITWFSSSCTVYGEPERVPLDESHSVGRVSSPMAGPNSMEEIIRDHATANENFQPAVLRYFNQFGAHPSGEIGEDLGIPDNRPFCLQSGFWSVRQAPNCLVLIIQLGTVPQ